MYDISPDMDMPKCPSCDTTVETNYLYCPSCHTQIQQVCDICGGYCDPAWRKGCDYEIGMRDKYILAMHTEDIYTNT
jgi:predicted amidophosphoribosyltransferase